MCIKNKYELKLEEFKTEVIFESLKSLKSLKSLNKFK